MLITFEKIIKIIKKKYYFRWVIIILIFWKIRITKSVNFDNTNVEEVWMKLDHKLKFEMLSDFSSPFSFYVFMFLCFYDFMFLFYVIKFLCFFFTLIRIIAMQIIILKKCHVVNFISLYKSKNMIITVNYFKCLQQKIDP